MQFDGLLHVHQIGTEVFDLPFQRPADLLVVLPAEVLVEIELAQLYHLRLRRRERRSTFGADLLAPLDDFVGLFGDMPFERFEEVRILAKRRQALRHRLDDDLGPDAHVAGLGAEIVAVSRAVAVADIAATDGRAADRAEEHVCIGEIGIVHVVDLVFPFESVEDALDGVKRGFRHDGRERGLDFAAVGEDRLDDAAIDRLAQDAPGQRPAYATPLFYRLLGLDGRKRAVGDAAEGGLDERRLFRIRFEERTAADLDAPVARGRVRDPAALLGPCHHAAAAPLGAHVVVELGEGAHHGEHHLADRRRLGLAFRGADDAAPGRKQGFAQDLRVHRVSRQTVEFVDDERGLVLLA